MSIDYDYKIYRLKEFYKIPDKPGLYSWHIEAGNISKLDKYHLIFKQKKFYANLEGSLGEKYYGELTSSSFLFDDEAFDDISIIRKASYIFCPPIYIGISKLLSNRLNTHKEQLQKIIYSAKEESEYIISDERDTDDESTSFARRIGGVLNDIEYKDLDSFFVKVMYFNNEISFNELFTTEKILNRTYNPIYGRK